jgi:hypothetical protein
MRPVAACPDTTQPIATRRGPHPVARRLRDGHRHRRRLVPDPVVPALFRRGDAGQAPADPPRCARAGRSGRAGRRDGAQGRRQARGLGRRRRRSGALAPAPWAADLRRPGGAGVLQARPMLVGRLRRHAAAGPGAAGPHRRQRRPLGRTHPHPRTSWHGRSGGALLDKATGYLVGVVSAYEGPSNRAERHPPYHGVYVSHRAIVRFLRQQGCFSERDRLSFPAPAPFLAPAPRGC